MNSQDIRVEVHPGPGDVILLRLSRPQQRNAMSVAIVADVLNLLGSTAGQAAGAIVIVGEGRGFCAGSDLTALAGMDMPERSVFEADCGRLARALTAHPCPVIAAVHGFAIGGGLTLAAACDIVVSTADAKWSLPEVQIGLFPAWGLEAVTMRAGRTRARRLSFGIDTLSGAEAAEAGLVDLVADDPLGEAMAIAGRFAALPLGQVAAVKNYFAVERQGEEADRHANRLFIAACDSDQARVSFQRFGRNGSPS
ncbi:enoyl-CoA hydratase/isomerase family protein [Sphingobium lactosutens]|uniref:enoyl-CoA hydratase/isomerase family protein n=1 Tax=Sphingobium lactosutens TaxID=522773 RepID=UPI0015BA345F|nr:enoyl-CoA hydratase/isomerase family protein [Sphingobium lactosutens]